MRKEEDWVIELFIVVTIIGIIFAVAITGLVAAQRTSARRVLFGYQFGNLPRGELTDAQKALLRPLAEERIAKACISPRVEEQEAVSSLRDAPTNVAAIQRELDRMAGATPTPPSLPACEVILRAARQVGYPPAIKR